MIDLNKLAKQTFKCAHRRGQLLIGEQRHGYTALVGEVMEVGQSSPSAMSAHLPEYTEEAEEMADVILVCLTELHYRGVNIENILKDKVAFNETRS